MRLEKNQKLTPSEREKEILTLRKGLKIRRNYEPDNPILIAIKKRLKILEKEEK